MTTKKLGAAKRSKKMEEKVGKIDKKRHEQGMMLVLALIVSFAMLVVAVPFIFKLSAQYRSADRSYKALAALNLAEAGVERAIWEMNHGDISTWDGDSNMQTLNISSFKTSTGTPIGDIDISVTDPQGDMPVIEATGKVPDIDNLTIVKKIRVVLEKTKPSVFDFGLFGNEWVHLNSNSLIDSYDSRDGLYGGSNVKSQGDVGTNAIHYGCISLDSNAEIHGDALSGPETNPEDVIVTESGSHIYGEKLALSGLNEMPSIPAPEGLPNRGDYFLGGGGQEIISESGEYSSFNLDNNSKVTIVANVTLYITGEFSMNSNTKLEIADGSSATIYLGGSFVQDSNAQFDNVSKDPSKLTLFGTDGFNGQMEWHSDQGFWGAIYVPRADVICPSNTDFYGSMIANSIDINSNGKIHYDESLGGYGSSSSSYLVKSWQEKKYQLIN